MRPSTTTAGGSRATGNARPGAATDGLRRPERQSAAPKIPRRVSGPIGSRGTDWTGRRSAAQRAGTPRRASRSTKVRAGSVVARALALRALSVVRSLPDHPLVDRMVRGRGWIPLLGVLLAGVVAMQVEELKLGASIGRSIERSSALESRNELLRASVAELSDEQRIERFAAGMGMIMAPPGAVGFLSADKAGSVERALANVRAPDPSAFTLQQSTNGAVVTGPDQTAATSSTAGGSSPTEGASATPGATATAASAATPATSATSATDAGSATTPTTPTPTATSAQTTSPAQVAPASQSGSTSGGVSAAG
jgi:hypothetical protein